MQYCKCDKTNAAVKKMLKLGWTFSWGGKHGKLKAPIGGKTLTVAWSPSSSRSFLCFKRDVRRWAVDFAQTCPIG
jgi:hypothetical protein